MPAVRWRARQALAEVLAGRNARDEARAELRGARDAFREMHAARLVERAERRAGTVGVSRETP
jgi:hypothetical protein